MDPQAQMMLSALMGQQQPQQQPSQQGIPGIDDQQASLGNQPPDLSKMMGALFQQPPQQGPSQ